MIFNLDLEGSVVLIQLEIGFKGILKSVGNQHGKVYVMGEERQQYGLGVSDGRQMRLELVRDRLWSIPTHLAEESGLPFLSCGKHRYLS